MPAILVVVWVAIITLFGYSLWLGRDRADDEANLGGQGAALESAGNSNTAEGTVPSLSDEERTLAESRDLKRLADMKMMRAILESYQKDKGYYPNTLDDLKPDYLENLPVNPTPGGAEYVYTGIGVAPYGLYDMTYELEVGAEDIEAGAHVMSTSGIAAP